MAVSLPCYCSREDVKAALDIKQTARNDSQIDRAIDSASRAIEGRLHRQFYPSYGTKYVDWPNFQYAYPWRVWLDQAEIADVTSVVPVVMTDTDVIPNANIFWGNPRYNPPFTYLELDRSTSSSFGHKSTPQRDITITALFGYSADTIDGGTLAAAVSTTTATTITVSNGNLIGVGNQLLIGTERLLVTNRANVTSTQTQQTAGAGTASNADNILAVTDGTKFFAGEVVTLDAERMLIVDVTGNNLTVKRAWDGTVLATHSSATIYVNRLFTVVRGSQGTTAATHSQGDAISVHLVPALVRQLAIGLAEVSLNMELGAYAATQGSGDSKKGNIGVGLNELWDQCITAHGRKARSRTV